MKQEDTFKKVFPLKPLNSKIKHKDLVGFDIETYGKKNKFLMCSFVSDKIIQDFWSVEDALKFLNTRTMRGKTCIATNLQFDSTGLFSENMDKLKILERKGTFISAKYLGSDNKTKVKFMDTMNIVPFSVETLGKIINVPKLPHPEFLGKIPKNDYEKDILLKYNLNDSYISFKFGEFIQNKLNKINTELKLTISSCSLDHFRRNYQKEDYFPNRPSVNKMIIQAYKGGRTEAFKRGLIDSPVTVYDVNSLYPFCMLKTFPHPNKYIKFSHGNKALLYDFEGVMHVKGFMPPHYIPSLPVRDDKKLIFPVNNLEGWFTFHELRYAIENQGFKITEYGKGVYYPKTCSPFKEMIKFMYKERLHYKLKQDPTELVFKLLMNSGYGKFGFRYFEQNTLMHISQLTKKMFYEADCIDEYGEFIEIKKKDDYSNPKPYCLPIWSCYVTSYARTHLNNYLINPSYHDHITYCDTDSIFMKKGKRLQTGDKLGMMKDEGTFNDLTIIRPKLYSAEGKTKAKGLGKMNHERFLQIKDNPTFERQIFVKPRTAIKSKTHHKLGILSFNEIINTTKTVDVNDTKRLWFDNFNWNKEQDSCPQFL